MFFSIGPANPKDRTCRRLKNKHDKSTALSSQNDVTLGTYLNFPGTSSLGILSLDVVSHQSHLAHSDVPIICINYETHRQVMRESHFKTF